MRRYSSDRYVPYLRTRYRSQFRWNANVKGSVHQFILLVRFIICIGCFTFAMNGMVNNFHSAVEQISEYKVAQLVSEYIDEGIISTVEQVRDYDFVMIARNQDGQVTSIETNSMEVNRLAAIMSESVLRKMKEKQHDKIMAPLGSLTGSGLLSSLGFSFPYRIIPMGKVKVSPASVFDTAGINQTIHRLQVDVSVNVKIVFPLMKKEEEIKRTVIVSETVIIGDVPNVLLSKGQ